MCSKAQSSPVDQFISEMVNRLGSHENSDKTATTDVSAQLAESKAAQDEIAKLCEKASAISAKPGDTTNIPEARGNKTFEK